LTKHRNDELPSVKAADLVNYVVLASVHIRRYVPYEHTVQPLAMGKMRTVDLRNIHWESTWMLTEP